MPAKRIYLIRHGETDMNLYGMVQGSGIDSDLNETGQEQARRFFLRYAGEGFKAVYTSALKRTWQSTAKFSQLGIRTERLPGLNEICWGEKEGRPITSADDEAYLEMITAWQAGQTNRAFVGGESPHEAATRMAPAIAHILAQPAEEKVLVCMHGRAMRILLCQILGYPLSCMEAFEHRNLCLYVLAHTGNMWQIQVANEVV